MRPVCVGRYTLEIPEILEPSLAGVTLYFIDEGEDEHRTVDIAVDIAASDMAGFERKVDRRAAEIASGTNFATRGSMLLSVERPGANTAMLNAYASPDLDSAIDHELHVLVRDRHVTLRARSFDRDSSRIVDDVLALAGRLSWAPDPTLAGAGFCLGQVVVDARSDYELAELKYRVTRAPHHDLGLELHLSSFPAYTGADRLLERSASGMGLLGITKRQDIRRGASQLAGHQAEEVLMRVTESGRIAHAFAVESYPDPVSIHQPMVRLQLSTGRSRDGGENSTASLSDTQAVELFDAIAGSLRPRADHGSDRSGRGQ